MDKFLVWVDVRWGAFAIREALLQAFVLILIGLTLQLEEKLC